MSPGAVERVDHEYVREGVCVAWMFVEPLGAWRGVRVTERRTSADWAARMRWLATIRASPAPSASRWCATT